MHCIMYLLLGKTHICREQKEKYDTGIIIIIVVLQTIES